jgi:hypothetical protein
MDAMAHGREMVLSLRQLLTVQIDITDNPAHRRPPHIRAFSRNDIVRPLKQKRIRARKEAVFIEKSFTYDLCANRGNAMQPV